MAQHAIDGSEKPLHRKWLFNGEVGTHRHGIVEG